MTGTAFVPLFLRAAYLVNPIGIDLPIPQLSWEYDDSTRNQRQTAYHILVASDQRLLDQNVGDLWDTGRVESDRSVHIPYGGEPLASGQRVYWKVRTWDKDDQPTDWSDVAFWEMGLLSPDDWKARWISLTRLCADPDIPEAEQYPGLLPVAHFRRDFQTRAGIRQARLYATARGVYEASINGQRVGDQVLAPGWTDYHKRIQYQTYDVTDLLTEGENTVAALLGTGWHTGYVGFQPAWQNYGPTPELLVQLHLQYDDGSEEIVCSDDQWCASTGPLRYADLLMGEYLDLRRDLPGWDRPGYDASAWVPVQSRPHDGPMLVADRAEPVRALDEIKPVAVTEPRPGVFVFNIGQNIAGWVRLKADGPAGTTIRLRFAEMLQPDGMIYTENLRTARQTDTVILSGNGPIEYEPKFTWHGFQYVEVTGYPGTPDLDAITARFVGSDTRPVGSFTCSDEMVNQLQRNIVSGQRDNFLSIPTDCPQRDERLGWLGDAQVFIRTATTNMDVSAFFAKWMRDVIDAQSDEGAFPDVAPRLVDLANGAPAWADAGVIIPWTLWQVYDDTRFIDDAWTAMERWMTYLYAANPNYLWQNKRNNDFGDWLAIGEETNKELIGTAYFAYDAKLMAQMATATGRTEAAERYRDLFARIRQAFNDAYVHLDGRILGDTQTTYVLALRFGLLDAEKRKLAAKYLVENIASKGWHLATGFVGVSYLCPVLTENGYLDVAYRLLHNDTFPSWGYSIRHGATTIWERWDGWTEEHGFQTPAMNSFNHYSLGSVGEWLFRTVAGIDTHPDAPGFGRIRIRPQPGGRLTSARGEYHSVRGRIASAWSLRDGAMSLNVEIPANTTAEVWLPTRDDHLITESGVRLHQVAGVHGVSHEGDATVIRVGSGRYHFAVPLPRAATS